ncbi:unnamed protein product [Amaranthus hypochondriacus]
MRTKFLTPNYFAINKTLDLFFVFLSLLFLLLLNLSHLLMKFFAVATIRPPFQSHSSLKVFRLMMHLKNFTLMFFLIILMLVMMIIIGVFLSLAMAVFKFRR